MYWKRFAALATGLVNKYKFDVFFRTTWNVILLNIVSSLVIVASIAIGFDYLYRDILITLITGIREGVSAPVTPESSDLVLQNIAYVRTKGFLLTAGAVATVTIVLGYIVTRITLKPAKNTLASQKQFIGNVAHELRTPLSIIKTNIEVGLLDGDVTPKIKQMLKSNIEELDRISDIINNLLSFNLLLRPEKMEFENVDLGAVVTSVVKKMSHFAGHKEMDISIEKGEFRIVRGNKSALEQIVMNLLKNAIAYTPEKGLIRISVEPDYRNFIELRVQDTGVGISREDLFHVFEPFYRADRSRVRRHGGSGLGLAVVNELVKIHHGKITLQSLPQKGTTVIVSLPCGDLENNRTATRGKSHREIEIDFSKR